MELFVGPLQASQATDAYFDFLLRFPNLKCVTVDVATAQGAALIRARYKIKPPDALIIGTAVTAGADLIVTNDVSWVGISPKPVVLLGDYV